MKKIVIMIVVFIMLIIVSAPDAIAGSRQSHRWEGVGIGIGGMILLNQIFRNNDRQSPQVYDRGYRFGQPRYQNQQVWIPAVRERFWIPSHYDQLGRWIRGEWVIIELAPGYWAYR